MAVNAFDLFTFFKDKNEHYPISDKFIAQYQQNKGGYIDYAKNTGHPIFPNAHEPNQKWHLFESWFLCLKLKKGTTDLIEMTTNGFKCPELLLWMAEAAGVDKKVVSEAAEYAKKKIDEIRQKSPNAPYSAEAAAYMNQEIKKKHKKSLWEMIVEKVSPKNC